MVRKIPSAGTWIEVWCSCQKVYIPAIVIEFNSFTDLHTIKYEDGEEEVLDLREHVWRLADEQGTVSSVAKNGI